MTRKIQMSHDYQASADEVWNIVIDFEALAYVMKGRVTFIGLPKGQLYAGQKASVGVSLFGILPAQPYHMEVLECDSAARRVRSLEYGAGVKNWRHVFEVVETPMGCRLKEEIEIDAGLMTPLFALWARYLYKARHMPRLRLLDIQNNNLTKGNAHAR